MSRHNGRWGDPTEVHLPNWNLLLASMAGTKPREPVDQDQKSSGFPPKKSIDRLVTGWFLSMDCGLVGNNRVETLGVCQKNVGPASFPRILGWSTFGNHIIIDFGKLIIWNNFFLTSANSFPKKALELGGLGAWSHQSKTDNVFSWNPYAQLGEVRSQYLRVYVYVYIYIYLYSLVTPPWST